MSGNDKVILFLVLIGMLISFAGILAIVVDKYKKAEREKAEDQAADAEEIKQKILQMHDYGEFLNKELADKQNEAMLMYEMLLEKEKKLAGEAALLRASAGSAQPAASEKVRAFSESSNYFKSSSPERTRKAAAENEQPVKTAAGGSKSAAEQAGRGGSFKGNDLSAGVSAAEEEPRQEEELINHNEEIKALYGQGLPAGEIAERLQIGKGQVELVIRLFCS